jgi:hypothetical protein
VIGALARDEAATWKAAHRAYEQFKAAEPFW